MKSLNFKLLGGGFDSLLALWIFLFSFFEAVGRQGKYISFPRSPVSNYDKLGGLKQQRFSFLEC